MDNHSVAIRSYNMSHIRSKGNKPEEIVCKYLFRNGFRYLKNSGKLPGCPDIVLPRYKTVIFVNGCFWHMHKKCKYFVWPKSNKKYWFEKLNKNKFRDNKNYISLRKLGWKVIVIWECELKIKIREKNLTRLLLYIRPIAINT